MLAMKRQRMYPITFGAQRYLMCVQANLAQERLSIFVREKKGREVMSLSFPHQSARRMRSI